MSSSDGFLLRRARATDARAAADVWLRSYAAALPAVRCAGPTQLAIVAAKLGIRMVHTSTDAVLSGVGRLHYDDSCLPDPITVPPCGAPGNSFVPMRTERRTAVERCNAWRGESVQERGQPLAGRQRPGVDVTKHRTDTSPRMTMALERARKLQGES
jgi:hypothetical protein